MLKAKWMLRVVLLILPVLFFINSGVINPGNVIGNEYALALPEARPPDTASSSRAPRFVEVRMKDSLETLVAGDGAALKLRPACEC